MSNDVASDRLLVVAGEHARASCIWRGHDLVRNDHRNSVLERGMSEPESGSINVN